MTEKLCESFNTWVVNFAVVKCGGCVEEQDVVIEVEECAEGGNEGVLERA